MIGAIEAVHSGTTTLSDDCNVAPRIQPEHVEAVFQAYEDLGIRALVGFTLFDKPFFRGVPFVDEEFPKELLAELDATKMYSEADLLAFVRGLARTHHPKEKRVARFDRSGCCRQTASPSLLLGSIAMHATGPLAVYDDGVFRAPTYPPCPCCAYSPRQPLLSRGQARAGSLGWGGPTHRIGSRAFSATTDRCCCWAVSG